MEPLPRSFMDTSSIIFKEGGKVINDPVHGYVTVSNFCLNFVDTPQFQRLRDLKQLGTTCFVFPGASHSRFEHSLGTSYLAEKWVRHLSDIQPELQISRRDVRLVSLAGLCHDLGHGPFSHSFEKFVSKIKGIHWSHEDMSMKMFDYLVDDNNIDIEKEDIDFVKSLISGHVNSSTLREKKFLFDIVSNSRNSVDVDKFDYLSRDCFNLNIKAWHDSDRLIKHSRVINDEICFQEKEAFNLYEMFHTRYSMHKQVYTHPVSRAVELMLCDCLEAAEPFLKVFDCIEDPSRFMFLNDSLLNTIESSREPHLSDARNILKRIRKRELYKMVNEVLINEEHSHTLFCTNVSNILPDTVDPHEIVYDYVDLNYAMKEKNPVDNCRFYSHEKENESFSIPKQRVSLLIPEKFKEKYLRMYMKRKEYIEQVNESLKKGRVEFTYATKIHEDVK